MRDASNGYVHGDVREALESTWPLTAPDEETAHLQADGFWGFEKGFHDAEQLRRQRQQQN